MTRRGTRRPVRLLCVALAAAGLGLASATVAFAHPLGNFTVNYASSISVSPQAIDVTVVVDRAEIPTIQALPDASVGHEPAGAPPSGWHRSAPTWPGPPGSPWTVTSRPSR